MLAYTGVHAVSVARGCIGNPWIFRQARQMLAGEPVTGPTIAEQRGCCSSTSTCRSPSTARTEPVR